MALKHDGTEGSENNPIYAIMTDGNGGTPTIDAQITGSVTIASNSTLLCDTVSLNTTPKALTSTTGANEVLLQAAIANTVNILIGNASAQTAANRRL